MRSVLRRNLLLLRPVALVLVPLGLVLGLGWSWDPPIDPLIADAPQPRQEWPRDLSAREILDRVTRSYLAVTTYRDSGALRDVWGGSPHHVEQRLFSTVFIRGGGFRFEHVTQRMRSLTWLLFLSDTRMVIWGDNARAKMWWSIRDKSIRDTTLSDALEAADGVSGGTSMNIPTLLLADSDKRTWIDELRDVRVVCGEAIRDRECYRIAGTIESRHEELWIDRETFLIHRISESTTVIGRSVTTTVAYKPAANLEIPRAECERDPVK